MGPRIREVSAAGLAAMSAALPFGAEDPADPMVSGVLETLREDLSGPYV